MSEEIAPAQFHKEGEPAFSEDTENDNSADSPSGQETEEDTDPADQGEEDNAGQDEDKLPFHEHPRWKQREDEWNRRYNEQETRHQEDLRKLREEFGQARKDNAEDTEIPSWFGGSQEQWNAYRKHQDTLIQQAEERAIKRLSEAKSNEDKAVKEATDYMNSEIDAIQADKTLNPTGTKIDPNKLLKIVLDNDLIDSKGRWNYRAGWRILQSQSPAKPSPIVEKKKIAGATNTENKGEKKQPTYKTSADFKKSRPW